jgi:hypothetical protein
MPVVYAKTGAHGVRKAHESAYYSCTLCVHLKFVHTILYERPVLCTRRSPTLACTDTGVPCAKVVSVLIIPSRA